MRPKGTLVLTKHGLKPIEDIVENDFVVSSSGFSRVLCSKAMGKAYASFFKVAGIEMRCSPDHRFAVAKKHGEGFAARNLEKDDELFHKMNIIEEGFAVGPKAWLYGLMACWGSSERKMVETFR